MKFECLFYQVTICLSDAVDDDSEVSGCDIVGLRGLGVVVLVELWFHRVNVVD